MSPSLAWNPEVQQLKVLLILIVLSQVVLGHSQRNKSSQEIHDTNSFGLAHEAA